MNNVTLLGNLVRDPDVRYTASGLAVVNVTVADNRKKKDGTEVVSFIDCTLWDKRGEAFAKFHSKGDRVLFQGRLEMDQWQDKTTGQNRTKLKVVVDNWEFVKSDTPAKVPENF